jgi:hypothetical protein
VEICLKAFARGWPPDFAMRTREPTKPRSRSSYGIDWLYFVGWNIQYDE